MFLLSVLVSVLAFSNPTVASDCEGSEVFDGVSCNEAPEHTATMTIGKSTLSLFNDPDCVPSNDSVLEVQCVYTPEGQ